MSLNRYRAKRDFKVTREPRGARRPAGRQKGTIQFVVQKHAARRLHYDFRLAVDQVLKSWAVPKGVPLRHGEKRLAMEVEDHPLDYGAFEGTIPRGNYGAGTVMLWDAGFCKVAEANPSQALKRGKLAFKLQGQKLNGEWTLVRMRPREEVHEKAWLLIKINGDADPVSARSDDRSILSGKTMKKIAATAERTRSSHRSAESNQRPNNLLLRSTRRGLNRRGARPSGNRRHP